jgi:N,N-dimethylformamidase
MYMGGNVMARRPPPAACIRRRSETGTRLTRSAVLPQLYRRGGRIARAARRGRVGFISQGSITRPTTAAEAAATRAAPSSRASRRDHRRFGLLQGGAAGIEIDAVDPALGTPPHALVVARSENHSNTYELVNEEVRVAHGMTDGLANPQIHADMVFFETAGGGAVFSTGSIAYAGALGHDGFDNAIAKLSWNVLRRFADPAQVKIPEK